MKDGIMFTKRRKESDSRERPANFKLTKKDMARLDTERQEKLEPLRMKKAQEEIEALGLIITYMDTKLIEFEFKGESIKFFPYSGWATGRSIKDGRGLQNLLKQLK